MRFRPTLADNAAVSMLRVTFRAAPLTVGIGVACAAKTLRSAPRHEFEFCRRASNSGAGAWCSRSPGKGKQSQVSHFVLMNVLALGSEHQFGLTDWCCSAGGAGANAWCSRPPEQGVFKFSV